MVFQDGENLYYQSCAFSEDYFPAEGIPMNEADYGTKIR